MQSPCEFGRYTLVARIAVGGMAEIFRARHEGPAGFKRDLIIKRVLPEFARSKEFLEMFLDEAKLVAALASEYRADPRLR